MAGSFSGTTSVSRSVLQAMRDMLEIMNNRKVLTYREIRDRLDGDYTYENVRNVVRGKSGNRSGSPIVHDLHRLLTNRSRMQVEYRECEDDPKFAAARDRLIHETPLTGSDANVFPTFQHWFGVTVKDTEQIIQDYGGTYVCFRPTFLPGRMAISRLKLGRNRGDPRLCFFKETESVFKDNVLKTHGYVIPVYNKLFLIGRVQNTNTLKVFIAFRMRPAEEVRVQYLCGIMSTVTGTSQEPFATGFMARKLIEEEEKNARGDECSVRWPRAETANQNMVGNKKNIVEKYESDLAKAAGIFANVIEDGVLRVTVEQLEKVYG